MLAATKNGAEVAPGACTYADSSDDRPCTPENGCIVKSNADLAFFQYKPPSTTAPHSCWTEVSGCPIGETNGTLHYCSINANPKPFPPTVQFQVGGGGSVQLIQAVRKIDIVYKASTDCGIFKISNQVGDVQTVDTYAPTTDWGATTTIARDVDMTQVNMYQLTVTNTSNVAAVDKWVQIVGLHIWL